MMEERLVEWEGLGRTRVFLELLRLWLSFLLMKEVLDLEWDVYLIAYF